MAERRLVPIGRVLHAHGTQGEVVVDPYLHDLTYYYDRLREVAIGRKDGQVQGYRVQQVRAAGERLLVQLDAGSNSEAARSLNGADLFAPRDELPPPGAGEFYWFDLEGLAVYTQEGDFLGRVEDFFPTGSNEVLVVRAGAREILLPFIKDVILAVDDTQGALRVRVIPGLL
jgi:16S rRNA processing protein RimM